MHLYVSFFFFVTNGIKGKRTHTQRKLLVHTRTQAYAHA